MQQNQQETEVKLHAPDLREIERRLQSAGAQIVSERVFERNVRYEDAANNLTERGIVVRLREDTRIRLTYKAGGNVQNGILTREELEVTVSDFDTMEQILARLGYTPNMVYEKYRTTYMLDGAEITLDEMPYGDFIEIEGEHDTIESVINRLDLQDAWRLPYSYSRLFSFVRYHLGLIFTDLTFNNFEGIEVPLRAFTSPDGS